MIKGVKMKKYLKLLLMAIAVCTAAVLASAFFGSILSDDGQDFDWYDVEDWEKEVCAKDAGLKEANNALSVSGNGRLYESSATLQALRKPSYNKSIYELAWYIHPIDEDVHYKVYLGTKKVAEGTASKTEGKSGYYAELSDEDYTKAKIDYGLGTLEVPVVAEPGGKTIIPG